MSWGQDHYWSENEVQRLKALWEQGLTTRVIGQRLGVTKNAVVGKIRRLGMSNSRPYYPPGSRTFHVRPAPIPEPEPSPPKPKRVRKPRPLIPEMRTNLRPTDPSLGSWTLEDLRYGVCKWPEGDRSPFSYCGDKALEGAPYCESHTRRARQGSQHRALRPIESYMLKRLARGG